MADDILMHKQVPTVTTGGTGMVDERREVEILALRSQVAYGEAREAKLQSERDELAARCALMAGLLENAWRAMDMATNSQDTDALEPSMVEISSALTDLPASAAKLLAVVKAAWALIDAEYGSVTEADCRRRLRAKLNAWEGKHGQGA